jgi:hypothetical protein
MSFIPWRTLALCATSAVLAGAGSAALAAGDDAPATAKAGDMPDIAHAIATKCAYAREHDPDRTEEICSLKPGDMPPVVTRVFGGPCDKVAGKKRLPEGELAEKAEFGRSAAGKPVPAVTGAGDS